jgi:hypothetical protein
MTFIRADLTPFLEDFFEAGVAAPLRTQGVIVHSAARDLFVLTVNAQIDAGIISEDKVVALLRSMRWPGIIDFYHLKFGNRPLSYNRMLRLLADMHDLWIVARSRSIRDSIANS